MTTEPGDFINSWITTQPSDGDPVGDGAEILRDYKGRIKKTFPNIKGRVTASHDHLNNPLLATARPTQGKTIPLYDSPTTAGTANVTSYGLTLFGLANSAALSQTLNLDAYLLKSGGTMTGPLAAPSFTVANTSVTINSTGVQLGPNARVTFDADAQAMNFIIGGKTLMTLTANALTVRANIIRGASS